MCRVNLVWSSWARMPRNKRIQFYVSILAEDGGVEGRSSVVSMHSECVMLDSNSGHKSGTVGLVMKPVHHKKIRL